MTMEHADSIKFGIREINVPIVLENFNLSKRNKIWDLSFIGLDKGRAEKILQLEKMLREFGVKSNFRIFSEDNTISDINNQRILYKETLNIYSQSKAILEIIADGQKSSTMRPIEAGALGVKLVTNDKSIIHKDFYNDKNIFILGVDSLNNIGDFLNTPFDESFDYKIYDIENWLEEISKA